MEQTHPITIDRQEALGADKKDHQYAGTADVASWFLQRASDGMRWDMDMGNGYEEAERVVVIGADIEMSIILNVTMSADALKS